MNLPDTSLHRYAFDHIDIRLRLGCPCQAKVGRREEFTILGLRALATPLGDDQHLQIEELTVVRIVAGGNENFDYQQPSVLRYTATAALKDPLTVPVIPIMQDMFEDVSAPTYGHGLKEIAAYCLAAIRDACGGEPRLCVNDDVWLVIQDTAHRWISTQNSRQQDANPTPPPISTSVSMPEKS